MKVLSVEGTNIDIYSDMKNIRGLVFSFEKLHCCHYFPNDPRTKAISLGKILVSN